MEAARPHKLYLTQHLVTQFVLENAKVEPVSVMDLLLCPQKVQLNLKPQLNLNQRHFVDVIHALKRFGIDLPPAMVKPTAAGIGSYGCKILKVTVRSMLA